MHLISIHNNWRDEVLHIDLNLGNYCNYKCWYCWPGSNYGTHKFPNLEIIKQNIAHLINYYKTHTNKKVFDVHFCGGEPTHWPKLPEFIKFLKTEFNCLISMTSNGSKNLNWWQQHAQLFNRIHMSCHHEFVEMESYRKLCDYLYEQHVVVSVSVMMDPNAWDKCIGLVEYFKRSQRKWTIRYVEIIDKTVNYSPDQYLVLNKHRARRVNLWFFIRNNKHYTSKVTAIDKTGKKYKFKDNEILLKKLNQFNGWECSVGVHWLNISMTGVISGTCNQKIYGQSYHYNLYDPQFTEKFHPTIKPSICEQVTCVCSIETVMPKQLLEKTRTVIPIYAN
jgi:organic radical activating enzyme